MQYLGFRITRDDEPVSDEREGALVAGTVGLRNAWKQAPGRFCADWDDKLAILLTKDSQVWSPVLAGIRYRVELAAIDPADIGVEPEPQRLISGGLANYQVLTEDSQHIPMRISANNDWLVPAVDLIDRYAQRATAKGSALVFEGLPIQHFRAIADDPRVGSVTEGAPPAQALAMVPGVTEVDGIVHRERGLIPTACIVAVEAAEGVSAPLVCGECGKKFKRKVTTTSTPKCPQCGSYDVDADYDDPGSDVFFARKKEAGTYDDWSYEALVDDFFGGLNKAMRQVRDDIQSDPDLLEDYAEYLDMDDDYEIVREFYSQETLIEWMEEDDEETTASADEVSASLLAALPGGVSIPIVDRIASSTFLVSWLNDVELAGRYDRG